MAKDANTKQTDKAADDIEAAAGKALVAAATEVDGALAVELNKGDLDVQIATAKAYPRSMGKAIRNVLELATTDTPTATECIYSIPRDGKLIVGPSIRLAELLFQQWGNNRVSVMIEKIDTKEGYVLVSASYHDLETNSALKRAVRRSIKGRGGHIFSADMINVTTNAAIAIAIRNAIFAGIPKPIWRQAFVKCLAIIEGDEKTLGERRTALLQAFVGLGLKPSQVMAIAGVAGEADINLQKMASLSGLYTAMKNGEITLQEVLGQIEPQTRDLASAFRTPETPQEAAGAAAGASAPAAAASATEPHAAPQSVENSESASPKARGDVIPPTTVSNEEYDRAIADGLAGVVEGVAEIAEEAKADAGLLDEPAAEDSHPQALEIRTYFAEINAAQSWDAIKKAAFDLRQTSIFKDLPTADRNTADEMAYRRTLELIGEEKTFVTAASDAQFFIWWLKFDAKPADARPMWSKLSQWEGYPNLPERMRASLAKAMQEKEAEGAPA